MIPKRIFQTWKNKEISNDLKELTRTWTTNNPDYEYYFYDDKDCEFFIKDNFEKDIFYSYKKIIPGAFKADLWRVCVLYKFGGFYCDLDTICLNGIDNFTNKDTEFIAPVDLNENCNTGHNLFNSFIGAISGSKIMKLCIERIVYNSKNNITNTSALDFSSCGVLGRSLNNYWNIQETSSFIGKEGRQAEIVLLKFDKEDEMVGLSGKYLFQNKNKNQQIKKAYQKQCRKDKVSPWFFCKNWLEKKKHI